MMLDGEREVEGSGRVGVVRPSPVGPGASAALRESGHGEEEALGDSASSLDVTEEGKIKETPVACRQAPAPPLLLAAHLLSCDEEAREALGNPSKSLASQVPVGTGQGTEEVVSEGRVCPHLQGILTESSES